jgi:conserved repeat domain
MKKIISGRKVWTLNELTFIGLFTISFLLTATSASANDLELSMTAFPDPVRPGELITYRYTVSNTGTEDLTGVTLTTTVPEETDTDVESITGGGGCGEFFCDEGEIVIWSFDTIFDGQSRTVEMVVEVDSGSSAPPDGTPITNSAIAEDNGGDTAVAEQSVSVDSTPVLTLEIAEDREPVESPGVLTYTITFGNREL